MKHEEVINGSYKHETKHGVWYLFWCLVTGLATGYGTYKIADHMEKSGYWRGIRTAYKYMDENEK